MNKKKLFLILILTLFCLFTFNRTLLYSSEVILNEKNEYQKFTFEKYENNPVVFPDPNSGGSGMLDPSVIQISNTYFVMYYLDMSTYGVKSICRATSEDGLFWTIDEANNPVLVGDPNEWDSFLWEARASFNENKIKLWYQGAVNGGGPFKTGYAESNDKWGTSFTKYEGNPIIEGSSGYWNEEYLGARDIEITESGYYMIYEGTQTVGTTLMKAGHCVSGDGKAWTKYPTNYVYAPGESIIPNIVTIGNDFLMFAAVNSHLGSQNSGKVYIAKSINRKNWIDVDLNPAIDIIGDPNEWDSSKAEITEVICLDPPICTKFRAYYRGAKSGDPAWKIGIVDITAIKSYSTNFDILVY